MIFWIFATLLFLVSGQDVSFKYVGCYSGTDGITMTAKYTGSGSVTVTAVQWYYSGQTSGNLAVTAATCTVFGSVPPGYPDASKMSFACPATHPELEPNTFQLTVTKLQGEELENSWGATFSLSSGSPPDVANSSFSVCQSDVTVKIVVPCVIGGLFLIGICIGVFMFCVNKEWNVIYCSDNPPWPVWISCIIVVGFGILIVFGIRHCCNGKGTTSPQDDARQGVESSTDPENKQPQTKLMPLNESGDKHHIGGRPLPEIGKYN